MRQYVTLSLPDTLTPFSGGGLFVPADPLPREQIPAILHRYASVKGCASDIAPNRQSI